MLCPLHLSGHTLRMTQTARPLPGNLYRPPGLHQADIRPTHRATTFQVSGSHPTRRITLIRAGRTHHTHHTEGRVPTGVGRREELAEDMVDLVLLRGVVVVVLVRGIVVLSRLRQMRNVAGEGCWASSLVDMGRVVGVVDMAVDMAVHKDTEASMQVVEDTFNSLPRKAGVWALGACFWLVVLVLLEAHY